MSKELTKRERKARIHKGQPIEALGLQFFPITMTDYEEFLECKSVLATRMTSLAKTNIEYLSLPFLAALWVMELDAIRATGKAIGFFERIIRMLYLSLRLEYDNQKAFSKIYCEHNNPRNLLYIEVEQTDGNPVQISPAEFTTIVRPLIAEQNGIDLPKESENPDIIQTELQMQKDNESKIKYDVEALIASVASANNKRQSEIEDWTVKEFETQRQALDRRINYMVYTQAEMSGMVKFQKGNPYPSWCFDRAETLTGALITVDDMQGKYKGAGDVKQAIKNPVNQNQLNLNNS